MNEKQVAEIIAETLSLTLKKPVQPGMRVIRVEEDSWDSLKHIEIMFALEGALGVQFTGEEIATVKDSMDIQMLVKVKLGT